MDVGFDGGFGDVTILQVTEREHGIFQGNSHEPGFEWEGNKLYSKHSSGLVNNNYVGFGGGLGDVILQVTEREPGTFQGLDSYDHLLAGHDISKGDSHARVCS